MLLQAYNIIDWLCTACTVIKYGSVPVAEKTSLKFCNTAELLRRQLVALKDSAILQLALN